MPSPAPRSAAPPGPLDGVRVLDFSRLLPGAWCTWLLAALGADVVKVEEPGRGDYQRDLGLPGGPRGAAVFQMVNQGKRSIALDLKDPAARPALDRLIARADVLVESFRPGVAQRLGLDFAALLAARPALVCLSISGFGGTGRLRDAAAHDINYLAMSGLLHRLVARGDCLPELPLADLIGGGLSGALNALALLLRARTTGIGGHADLALADGVPLLPSELTAAALSGQPLPEGPDSPWSGEAPNYRIYALADGHVAVGAVEPRFWENFRRRMGLEDAPPEDSAAWPGLTARIAARFRTMTRAGAEALFDGADACVTVLRSPAEACGSDLARDRAHTAPAPAADAMPRLGSPFFLDGSRRFAEGPAPQLGEHTGEILAELGLAGSPG